MFTRFNEIRMMDEFASLFVLLILIRGKILKLNCEY